MFSSFFRIDSDYLPVLTRLSGLCNGDGVYCEVVKTDF